MRSRSTLAKLLVVLVTIGLGLAGAEFAVRVREPVPPDALLPFPMHHAELARLQAGDTYIRFDPELGWSQRPGIRTMDDGIEFSANAAGFRASREYEVSPPDGVTRVAAFGDSFVHCDEVAYPDCWTARLEAAWSGSEVLNFGIPAGAPDQGLLRYRRDARALRPCVVLIGFQVENVNRVVNRFRPFYASRTGLALSKPRFVLDGAGLRLVPNPAVSVDQLDDPVWVEQNLGPNDYWYFPGMFVPGPLDSLMVARLARTAQYRQYRSTLEGPVTEERPNGTAYQPDDERFQVAGRLLTLFAREVQADGATPVVVFFGQKSEVVTVRHRDPKEYQPLLDWMEAEEIPVIDVTNDLAREANRSGVDSLFARGGHYNRRGNQSVGASVAERLPKLSPESCP
ncbi:MAG: hypothetical protein AB7P40_09995 [Chloroflexota bacterium]